MRTQKGSLMIEVIAVLGLIALITPVLFRQIARRNEDIVAMQVASEMRAVKDALAAYIQAYEENIAESCMEDDDRLFVGGSYVAVDDEILCRGDAIKEAVFEFYAGGLDAGNAMMHDYVLGVYGYTVPAKMEGDVPVEYRPVLYGVVYQETSEETLRMASKIAGLIGLDGGVATETGTVSGVQGAWTLPVDGITANTVAAVTSFDDATNTAILKDVKLEHFAGETMQATTSTSSRMAVSDLLSVGDGLNCILKPENQTVQVAGRGEKDDESNVIAPNCAPLFEVNAADGVVRLVGSVLTEKNSSCADLKTKDDCEVAAYCTWDAKGGVDSTGVCEARHKIDLSAEGISSMHDIKLTSRGGAKLSDLLPTYSLKGYEKITASKTLNKNDFDCGSTGTQALIVVPTKVTATPTTTSASGASAHTHTVTVTVTQEQPAEKSLDVTLGTGITEAIVYKYCVFDGTTATTAR